MRCTACSRGSRFPSFSGTNVFRDFVELPSQVNELWMLRPEVLAGYAVHHETGERMPQHARRPPARVARPSTRASRPPNTSQPRCSTRRGTASRPTTPDAVTDVAAFERDGLVGGRPRRPAGSAALLEHVLRARLRRRLRRGLLLVHLERGRGRRHHGLVRGATAAPPARTAIGSAPRSSRRAAHATRVRRSRALLGREPTIEPLLARRGLA